MSLGSPFHPMSVIKSMVVNDMNLNPESFSVKGRASKQQLPPGMRLVGGIS